MDIDFTGEFLVPGKAGERIEADHMARYRFACNYASEKTILDIACGFGYGSNMLVQAGASHVDGVDISSELIQNAQELYRHPSLTFSVGDIRTFGAPGSYDLSTCFETIEHVREYQVALRNLFSLLRPGGTLIISSPNRRVTSPRARTLHDQPTNVYHTQEFTPEELMQELQAVGFVLGETSLFGQRQRRLWTPKIINKVLNRIFRPDETTSPELTPVTGLTPRYFVIIARKPATL